MKDVNDLMQAILEMDAAQRKASEKAKAERTARLAALDARKQAIAAECDAKCRACSYCAIGTVRHLLKITTAAATPFGSHNARYAEPAETYSHGHAGCTR